jgi:hypothetical protein
VIAQRTVTVRVEKLWELYLGEPTGDVVYHVIEMPPWSRLFRGCPLGRGRTEAEAAADFVLRANLDNRALKLRVAELTVGDRRDYTAR